jgi:hypothetical protein
MAGALAAMPRYAEARDAAAADTVAPDGVADEAARGPAPAVRHDVHVSVSRVVLEDGTIFWRIRGFADDLERALRGLTRDSTFTFAATRSAVSDSLFTRYFTAHVQVDADGRRTTPRLVSSGTEDDEAGGPVRWYLFAFDVPRTTKSLRIRHALLFDVFRDQQNLVTWLDAASGRRQPLYFTAGNDVPQTITR